MICDGLYMDIDLSSCFDTIIIYGGVVMKKSKYLLGGLLMSGMLVMSGCSGAADEKPVKDVNTEEEAETKEEKEEVKEEEPAVAEKEEPEEEVKDEEVTEEPEEAEEENLEFLYEQYYDIVSGLDEKWDQFMFVYFDQDNFPDIVVSSTQPGLNDLNEYMIITHSNAGAEVNEDLRDGVASAGGYRGTLYYVPQMGILYERTNYAPANNPGDNVYLPDNGHLTLYATGRTEVLDGYTGPDDIEHMTWYWNDVEVTPDEYEEKLKAETNNLSGDALSSLFYVDRESMLNRLENSMN